MWQGYRRRDSDFSDSEEGNENSTQKSKDIESNPSSGKSSFMYDKDSPYQRRQHIPYTLEEVYRSQTCTNDHKNTRNVLTSNAPKLVSRKNKLNYEQNIRAHPGHRVRGGLERVKSPTKVEEKELNRKITGMYQEYRKSYISESDETDINKCVYPSIRDQLGIKLEKANRVPRPHNATPEATTERTGKNLAPSTPPLPMFSVQEDPTIHNANKKYIHPYTSQQGRNCPNFWGYKSNIEYECRTPISSDTSSLRSDEAVAGSEKVMMDVNEFNIDPKLYQENMTINKNYHPMEYNYSPSITKVENASKPNPKTTRSTKPTTKTMESHVTHYGDTVHTPQNRYVNQSENMPVFPNTKYYNTVESKEKEFNRFSSKKKIVKNKSFYDSTVLEPTFKPEYVEDSYDENKKEPTRSKHHTEYFPSEMGEGTSRVQSREKSIKPEVVHNIEITKNEETSVKPRNLSNIRPSSMRNPKRIPQMKENVYQEKQKDFYQCDPIVNKDQNDHFIKNPNEIRKHWDEYLKVHKKNPQISSKDNYYQQKSDHSYEKEMSPFCKVYSRSKSVLGESMRSTNFGREYDDLEDSQYSDDEEIVPAQKKVFKPHVDPNNTQYCSTNEESFYDEDDFKTPPHYGHSVIQKKAYYPPVGRNGTRGDRRFTKQKTFVSDSKKSSASSSVDKCVRSKVMPINKYHHVPSKVTFEQFDRESCTDIKNLKKVYKKNANKYYDEAYNGDIDFESYRKS